MIQTSHELTFKVAHTSFGVSMLATKFEIAFALGPQWSKKPIRFDWRTVWRVAQNGFSLSRLVVAILYSPSLYESTPDSFQGRMR